MFYYYLSENNNSFIAKGFVYSANHLQATLNELAEDFKGVSSRYSNTIKEFAEYFYQNIDEINKGDTISFKFLIVSYILQLFFLFFVFFHIKLQQRYTPYTL